MGILCAPINYATGIIPGVDLGNVHRGCCGGNERTNAYGVMHSDYSLCDLDPPLDDGYQGISDSISYPGEQAVWFFPSEQPPLTEIDGTIQFAVCCKESINIRLRGQMRILSPGQDNIQIWVNGALQYEKVSDEDEGQAWWFATHGVYTTDPHACYYWDSQTDMPDSGGSPVTNILIYLTPRACGNKIEIKGGSGGTHATESEYASHGGGLIWIAQIDAINATPVPAT